VQGLEFDRFRIPV